MPIIFRFGDIKFYIYSREHLPIHVHIKQGDRSAVLVVESLKIIKNHGFHFSELRLLQNLVKEHAELIEEFSNDYFKENKE